MLHTASFFYNKALFNLHGDLDIYNRSDDGDIQAREISDSLIMNDKY